MKTIVSQLEMSDMVGIDEAGAKVNGAKYWHWVFQNDTAIYIVADQSRGTKVIDDHFKEGFVNAVVVHDNFSSYNFADTLYLLLDSLIYLSLLCKIVTSVKIFNNFSIVMCF